MRILRRHQTIHPPRPTPRVPLCALLMIVAVTAGFTQSLDSLLDRAPFTPEAEEEIVRIFEVAKEARVPEELLRPRLAEGIAKRVPAGRIVTALTGEVTALLEARSLLLEVDAEALLADTAAWARTANLMTTEVSDKSIQLLAVACSERTEAYRPAGTLLLSMLEWGLEEQDAVALTLGSVASGLDPDDYPVVLDVLIRGRLRRAEISDMVDVLKDLLPEVDSPRELHRSVRW